MRPRKPSKRVACRNAGLLERIRQLKAEHPYWGYRRIWAYLRVKENVAVNAKRIYRLMKVNGLLVPPNRRLRASRTIRRSKPMPGRPNQWWGIDMTKLMTMSGWVYVTVVLDWCSKKVVGWHVGQQSKAAQWLEALNGAVNRQFPFGVRGRGLRLMSDNGCQPSSGQFKAECNNLGIEQVFTAYNNPKGNADTERFMRTLKEECLWLQEWSGLSQVKKELEQWFEEYNTGYLHSALGYMPPAQFEQRYEPTRLKSA